MAKELSRTFDLHHGAVFVKIEDSLGNVHAHTIYVRDTQDVEAAIADALARTKEAADDLTEKFKAAGWVQGGS